MMRSRNIVAAAALVVVAAAAGCKGGSSKSEAEANLETIEHALKARFDKVGAFPTGRVGPTPPIVCCNQPEKECGDDPTAWQLPLWTEVGFSVKGKHRFVYTYEGNATSYTVTAEGDLDCDKTGSKYVLTGTAEGKKVTTKLTKPERLD
jgi:hypothetical protein